MSDAWPWRKVSEAGLPEVGRDVLVCVRDAEPDYSEYLLFSGVLVGRITAEEFGPPAFVGYPIPIDENDGPWACDTEFITHWMPSPTVPQEEA